MTEQQHQQDISKYGWRRFLPQLITEKLELRKSDDGEKENNTIKECIKNEKHEGIYMMTNKRFTWWGFWPLWLNNDFGPSSKDGSPHAVVERMRGQAKEFIATVCTQAMNEQGKVNGYDCFTQQHVELRLVLLPGRRQQRNQG